MGWVGSKAAEKVVTPIVRLYKGTRGPSMSSDIDIRFEQTMIIGGFKTMPRLYVTLLNPHRSQEYRVVQCCRT